MTGTDAHLARRAMFGQEELPGLAAVLNGQGPGAWHDTALEIDLPAAGDYRLGGTVLGHLDRLSDGSVLVASLEARLFDVSAGAEVPLSHRLVISYGPAQGITTTGGVWHHRATTPLDVLYTVASARTIRLQGRYQGPVAESGTTAAFMSAGGFRGRTLLNYSRL
ncbi:hypothetical protein AB0F88_16860 [Streptosporangium sp. NPDC023963]|uniref:hypothetical protein n=1 Tax=Streptosporangium sp. NPDC023963 TaxID=3155608 RepID=UPI0034499B4E